MLIPVVLSGGSGTRLWPLSRKMTPKQLLPLIDDKTLLQNTLDRFADGAVDHGIIVCNDDHRFMVAEQVRNACWRDSSIILEPVGRNTAPAAALAAIRAQQLDEDAVLVIMPADHDIRDVAGFRKAVELAADSLQTYDGIVTFGITPDRAATGFGYIKAGEQRGESVFDVDGFIEKPDLQMAETFTLKDGYYWNSGIFVCRATDYLALLGQHAPAMFEHCSRAMDNCVADQDFIRIEQEAFEYCPPDSIDYAIMEHIDNSIMIPVDIGWNDVGSFAALYDFTAKDDQGNACVGDVVSRDTTNCYMRSEDRMLVGLGIDNLVVVDTDDAVLVANRSKVHDIKHVVDELIQTQREEVLQHNKVARPWGSFTSIDAADGFKVKRLSVNPGAALSLQMHSDRAEHWIIVAGTATVTRGDEVFQLQPNDATFIPPGVMHRLENTGEVMLELIEIQTGTVLEEDNIVRFDDIYGRSCAV